MRKSTTDYVFPLGNGAISWPSKKQLPTTLSTLEAKYKTGVGGTCEAIL